MFDVFRIDDHPSAIASRHLDKIVGPATEDDGLALVGFDLPGKREVGAVVLHAATEHATVALRNVDVVEHADGEPVAPVFPVQAAVHADVHAAIVHVVDESGLIHRHEKAMMIRMGIMPGAARGVPSRGANPVLAAVKCPIQIDAPT